MSPNSYLAFNDQGLLCGYQGEAIHEEPCFTWTYAEFEEYLNESITPSMYHYMASYVRSEISKEELYEIQGGDYCTGRLEEEAVDAYFDLPINDRITMHEQELVNLRAAQRSAEAKESAAIDAYFDLPINDRITMHEQELVNLRAAKRSAEAKESAAIDAMLTENKPFDDSSPIALEYSVFMRGLIIKNRAKVDRLEREIHEEEQWRGGHEEGAEDMDE